MNSRITAPTMLVVAATQIFYHRSWRDRDLGTISLQPHETLNFKSAIETIIYPFIRHFIRHSECTDQEFQGLCMIPIGGFRGKLMLQTRFSTNSMVPVLLLDGCYLKETLRLISITFFPFQS